MRQPALAALFAVMAPLLMAQSAPPAPAAAAPAAPVAAPTPVAGPLAEDRSCAARCLTPVEAVTLASQVAPKAGLVGRFAVLIKAVGERDGRFYLNSETDYRDRNCLTLVLTPEVAAALAGRADLAALRDRWVGQRIYVDGVARRVTIFFTANGKPTDKYYYQVHVPVRDSHQIHLNGDEAPF